MTEEKITDTLDNIQFQLPEDMFKSDKIENDLKFVDTTIREYYEI